MIFNPVKTMSDMFRLAFSVFLIAAIVITYKVFIKADEAGIAMAAAPYGLSALGDKGKANNILARKIANRPDALLNITGSDVHAVFSVPELTRRDLPTIVWQYRSASCVLDVFFASMKNDVTDAPVVYYEIRGRQNDMAGGDIVGSCLNSILERRGRAHLAQSG